MIRNAVREGRIDRASGDAPVTLARAGVITEQDRRRVGVADEARADVIQVDAFDPDEYRAFAR